jgi:membrane protease subunit HflK
VRERAPSLLADSVATALPIVRWAGVLLAGAVLLSGMTIVRPDEVAIRLRFGRLTGVTRADQVHGPGLLLALPYLIDEIVRVPVKRIQALRVQTLAAGQEGRDDALDLTRTGYALTGDRNVVQLVALLKYQVADPVVWALRIDAPLTHVEDAVTAALTRTLAEMRIDAVLVEEKARLAAIALDRAQQRLDRDGPWVQLVALELVSLRPPRAVANAFEDVQTAFVERKTKLESARGFRAQELPAAAAAAQRDVAAATAEAASQVAQARGQARAFTQLLDEYRRNPDVVRQRLYREAMQQVLAQTGHRILLAPGARTGPILLPADDTPLDDAGAGHR